MKLKLRRRVKVQISKAASLAAFFCAPVLGAACLVSVCRLFWGQSFDRNVGKVLFVFCCEDVHLCVDWVSIFCSGRPFCVSSGFTKGSLQGFGCGIRKANYWCWFLRARAVHINRQVALSGFISPRGRESIFLSASILHEFCECREDVPSVVEM